MIIPFIFNMSTYSEAPYTWFFFKGLDMAKHHDWPIMGQEIYVKSSLKDFIKMGERAAYDADFIKEHLWYETPHSKDFKHFKGYAVNKKIIDDLVKETGSYLDAYLRILRAPYEPLVEDITRQIEDIKANYSEPIEAFCVLSANPSLSAAAAKFNIPVLHYEMGCFREPVYMKTAFMDTQSLHGGNTTEVRFKKFQSEMKGYRNIMSPKELLALLLRPEKMDMLDKYGTRPEVRCGAALGYAVVEIFQAQSGFNDSELLYRLARKYGTNNMLIRMHPFDPYGAKYPKYSMCVDKKDHSTIDFILSCEEIFSIGSNVCVEAMFWGRKAHTMVKSPSYYGSAHTVEEKAPQVDPMYLNFFAMNYLIPFRFMMDPEYIRWRLSVPSEKEIFEKHLAVHLANKKLDMSVMDLPASKRLKAFKEAKAVY